MKYLGTKGDTIVEVLIAIAIVSVTLSGAFLASRRSFAVSQQSQERGEATKLVEEQLERLKSVSSRTSPGDGIFAPGLPQPFCLNAVTVVSAGAACVVGPQARYTAQITRGTGANANTYTVLVTWEKVGGGQQERLSAVYKVYPK